MTGGTYSKNLLKRGSSDTQKMRATRAARNPKSAIGSVMSAVFADSMDSSLVWLRVGSGPK